MSIEQMFLGASIPGLGSENWIDPSVHHMGHGAVRYGKEKLPCKIYEKEELLTFVTEQAMKEWEAACHEALQKGAERPPSPEPAYEKVLMIEFQLPPTRKGKEGDLVVRPLQEKDKYTYARAWQRYLNKQTEGYGGTPLEEWKTPLLDIARIKELSRLNVLTMEDVCNMPDGVIGALGHGGRVLQMACRQEMTKRAAKKPFEVMEYQISQRDEVIAKLEERLQALEQGPSKPTKPAKTPKKEEQTNGDN